MSSSVAGWIAIGAAVVAVAAVALALAGIARQRSARTTQRALLDGGSADLVDFAVALQSRIDALHRRM
ncbi:MAG TPA: hypothetical protein VE995_04765, partial [Gaiellaceae bacterium]|nr:hypothetical protein [Gaiellaceae bacterium]